MKNIEIIVIAMIVGNVSENSLDVGSNRPTPAPSTSEVRLSKNNKSILKICKHLNYVVTFLTWSGMQIKEGRMEDIISICFISLIVIMAIAIHITGAV